MNRIANALTLLYRDNKNLPRKNKFEVGNYAEPDFDFIMYKDGAFYYSGWQDHYKGSYIVYEAGNPISMRSAIQEVWNRLNDDIRTTIMSEILGARNVE